MLRSRAPCHSGLESSADCRTPNNIKLAGRCNRAAGKAKVKAKLPGTRRPPAAAGGDDGDDFMNISASNAAADDIDDVPAGLLESGPAAAKETPAARTANQKKKKKQKQVSSWCTWRRNPSTCDIIAVCSTLCLPR